MSWKEIFKDNNEYNEKSIIGFCAFVIMCIVMIADVVTGWTGSDLVINEAIYNSFVMVVLGYDYYHYTKKLWLHSWASILPLHISAKNEYSYTNFVEGNQWFDYTGGLIFGYQVNKRLGIFSEGKYHKYWNRKWHDFSIGFNYRII